MESSVPATPPPSQPPQNKPREGFFQGLMDTRFDHLITPSLIRVLYVISIVLIGLAMLGAIIAGFAESAGSGIVLLILAPIVALLYLIATRVWLELVIVVFKIRDAAEDVAVNTRKTGP